MDFYTRKLAAIREELGLTKVHILGSSRGTMLVVENLITRMPFGVVSLVLSAPWLSASRWYGDQRHYIEASCRNRETIKG